jgi:hypothetical protein
MQLGEVHRDVAAVGMPDQGQVTAIGTWVLLLQFVDGELDVGNAAVVLHPAADIFHADLRHHRIVGIKVVLNAHDQVAARRKQIGEERILGKFDRVAVAEDRNRQLDHFGRPIPFRDRGQWRHRP